MSSLFKVPTQTLCALLTATLLTGVAQADWVVGQGATTAVNGGTVDLGCVDFQVRGDVSISAGGALSGARNIVVEPGGSALLDGARMELSQVWDNRGSVTTPHGGQIFRLASAGCPLLGPAGRVWVKNGPKLAAIPSSSPSSLVLLTLVLLALAWRNRFSFRT